MDLIRSSHPRPEAVQSSALTIGNFDGLHLGHQALIERVVARAPELLPALMCFEPLPAAVFRPENPPPRLMGIADRLRWARQLGVGCIFMPRFNRTFAALGPEEFVLRLVRDTAKARHVVVGSDFRFGARAAGDVEQLVRFGKRYGFSVEVVEPVCSGAEKVSSTRLRDLLGRGKLDSARALLGRPYTLCGRVLRGQQLGRTLGFPTVNLRPPVPPALQGVFAVRVRGGGLDHHPGVANLGRRPTVEGTGWLLEAHLFDYDGSLYGERLEVEFVEFLRGELRFDSLESMTRQMQNDARQARAVLATTTSDS